MAVNLFLDEEEQRRQLSAGQAAVPMYGSMQTKGIGAAGDIFGIDTAPVDLLNEQLEESLKGFTPKFPERLLETEKPVQWWTEKAALNSMNTIVPMLGYAVGTTMQAIPHPVAKVIGTAINWGTYALTYNANFADTLQEHEDAVGRELTASEKAKAAAVASGVTYLDMLAPMKGAAPISNLITKTFGKGGLETTKKSLEKLVNSNREGLRQQLGKGAKHMGKLIGTEMSTEAAQKAIQIGTSATPGRLGTSEGMQDILEEAVIAGPIAGAIGSPGSVGVAREANRDIATARRLAEGYNKQVMEGTSPTSETKVEAGENKPLIDIPELDSNIKKLAKSANLKIEKVTGVDVAKAGEKFTKGLAFKPLSDLVKIRNESRTGAEFHAANRAYQRFAPVGTASGTTQVQDNFFSIKETKTGEYLAPVVNVINKYAQKKAGIGFILQRVDPERSKYIRERLQGKPITAKVDQEFIDSFEGNSTTQQQRITNQNPEGKTDLQIVQDQIALVRQDLVDSGVSIGLIDNYLTNPISADVVKENREAFIKALIASSRKANRLNKEVKPITRKGSKNRKGAEQIADEIIQGLEPDVLTAREQEALANAEFKGQKRKGFEKSRAEAWKYLDEFAAKESLNFRETDIEKVLTGYLQRGAARVASVRAFGKDAQALRDDMKILKKAGNLTKQQRDKIYDTYDAAHNTYKKDLDPNLSALSKLATGVGAVTHLGLATISSITELAWIGERAGFLNMLKTLPKALDYSIKGTRRGLAGKYVQPGEGAMAMATLGFNLDPRVNERLDQIFSTDHNMVVNMYFRTLPGGFLTQWTNFNRNWAAQAMMTNINTRANKMKAGTLSNMERMRLDNELKENGVSKDEWNFITKVFEKEDGRTIVDITNEAALNTAMPNGKKVREVLIPWLHKVVDDVVVHPKATNKPLWMSDPKFAIIAQLKTFPVVFGNTVVKRLLRKLNPKQCSPDFGAAIGVVGGIASAYALVLIGEAMKDAIKGQDWEDPTVLEVMDRAGLTGVVGLLGSAGRFHDGATTSLLGTGAGFIDRAWEEAINPIWSGDSEAKMEVGGNLIEWLTESLDSTLGVAGIYFTPTGDLFGVDK
jgi:hypothetical protein